VIDRGECSTMRIYERTFVIVSGNCLGLYSYEVDEVQ
jgi:hypothetical protein